MAKSIITSNSLSIQYVRDILSTVPVGYDGIDIVAHGWIEEILVNQGHVLVTMNVPPEQGSDLESVRKLAEDRIFNAPDVISATVILSSEGEVLSGPSGQDLIGATPGANYYQGEEKKSGQEDLIRDYELESSVEDCSAPGENERIDDNIPTPINEMISIIENIPENPDDGIDNLLALAYRKDFPPSLCNLALALSAVLQSWRAKE